MASKRLLLLGHKERWWNTVLSPLREEGYAVEVSSETQEAFERIYRAKPDLLVLGISSAKDPSLELLRRVRNDPRTSPTGVLAVSDRNEDRDAVLAAFRAGADDVVSPPFHLPVLSARIAALLRRSARSNEPVATVLRIGPISIDPNRHWVELDGKPLSLTLTEFRLLAVLAAAQGNVLSRNQLIDQAIGMDALVTDRTIDVHLTSLRRKLGRARQYVKTVRGVGYRVMLNDEPTTSP